MPHSSLIVSRKRLSLEDSISLISKFSAPVSYTHTQYIFDTYTRHAHAHTHVDACRGQLSTRALEALMADGESRPGLPSDLLLTIHSVQTACARMPWRSCMRYAGAMWIFIGHCAVRLRPDMIFIDTNLVSA